MARPRLWPAVVLPIVGAAWVFLVRRAPGLDGQTKSLQTAVALVATGAALAIWFLFLSRLTRHARVVGVAVALAGAVLLVMLFRIRGLTGDFVPVIEPRWASRPAVARPRAPEALPPPPAPTAAPVTAPPPSSGPATAPVPPPPEAEEAGFPQFLGPSRDGTLAGPTLARDWQARPPREVWRVPVGEGWSGFAVARGVAVTQEQHGEEERVVAYDPATGRVRWSHGDPARFATTIAGIGPRATPAIAGGRVFTLGATGILNALELATGRVQWTRNVLEEHRAVSPEWGKSSSPLVDGGRVVISVGGPDGHSLVAYDAQGGAPVWSAGSDRSSYSTPAVLTLAGRRQLVALNAASLTALDPATGTLLWEQPFPGGQPNVASPVATGPDRVMVSVGYGIGSKSYQVLDRGGSLVAAPQWESPRLKSKFANFVVYDGLVYGLDDGVLTCLDPATGERRWKDGRYGHGQLLLVGRLLLVQTEDGEVVLVEPAPDALRELARVRVLDGKTWNPPALAGRLLLVRNDREAAAFQLPVE
jgi:outer membrane protein assembly factor BamB